MIDNCGLVSTDRLDADRYTSLQRLERALNQAIVKCISSIILSSPNGYVKMSPYETGDMY